MVSGSILTRLSAGVVDKRRRRSAHLLRNAGLRTRARKNPRHVSCYCLSLNTRGAPQYGKVNKSREGSDL
jgi:hypothetical protein